MTRAGRSAAGPGFSRPGRTRSLSLRVALAGIAVLATGPGCRDRPAGVGDDPSPPRVRPSTGPWFVDRARDYRVDVVTPCGGPEKRSVVESIGAGVALFDFDADGDLDIYVTACSRVSGAEVVPAGGPWLFRNDGLGRWTDVTAGSGLRWSGWAQAVAVADYDADGDPDLFVAHLGPDVLWQNQGDGTFRDVTDRAGIRDREWGVGATWGDADGDGWPDLYVTNYLETDPAHPPPALEYKPGVPVFRGPSALPGQPDRLWRNRGDGTFEDATAAAGLDQPGGKGMAALFADWDGDGKPDLFVTNDTQANHFFRGLGSGRFHEEGLHAGVALNGMGMPEGSMGVDAADVDGDGLLDLVHANFRHEGTRLYRNLGGGRFQDISTGSYVGVNTLRFVGWGVVLADFDDDGWPDLFQANGHVYPNVTDSDYAQPPLFLRNRGDGTFEPATVPWGPDLEKAAAGGRSVAAGDLDGDGDLDLVVTTMDGPLRVLINEGTQAHHSVEVRLIGKAPGRDALGAWAEIEAGGRTQRGQVRSGGSFLAAPDTALHFGLGGAGTLARLTFHWADGTRHTFENLAADARHTVRQDYGRLTTAPFRSARIDRTPITIPGLTP